MEKPLSLNLLYTHQIRGDLQLLPRLYTFIQSVSAELKDQSGDAVRPLLLDLGDSCSPQVWHCLATGGRSTIIVLDGMGYHAVNTHNILSPEERGKMAGLVHCGMVDWEHSWEYNVPPVSDPSILVTTTPIDTPSLRLQIIVSPANATRLQGNLLHLASVEAGQLGIVQIDLQDYLLIHHEVRTMPPSTLPNPTITASVDFVESEARLFQRKNTPD